MHTYIYMYKVAERKIIKAKQSCFILRNVSSVMWILLEEYILTNVTTVTQNWPLRDQY